MTVNRSFAIVPAAGASRRMGTAKLLLTWGERTIIESVIAAYRTSGMAVVVAVVAPGDSHLAEACQAAGAEVVVPDVAPPDMKASLQAGLRWIGEHHNPLPGDAVLVAPADMPWLRAKTIERIVATFNEADPVVVVTPTHAGRRGHPVAFAWRLADEVLDLTGDESLKTMIARHDVLLVECDETVLGDLDTPEEYEAARKRYLAT